MSSFRSTAEIVGFAILEKVSATREGRSVEEPGILDTKVPRASERSLSLAFMTLTIDREGDTQLFSLRTPLSDCLKKQFQWPSALQNIQI